MGNSRTMSTKEYCKVVQTRFKNNPAVYRRFGQIIQELRNLHESADRLEMVKQLITLFDGHQDLILNMNAFLPEEYCIEMQDDAVVIKVFEQFGETTLVDTGHSRTLTNPNNSHSHVASLGTSVESIGYIVHVKKAYEDKPQVYSSFIGLLQEFHSKKVDELATIHRVVALFKTRPDLVLGFNEFLPPGYSIHMYEKSGYVIEHPSKDGDGVNRVRIMINDKHK